MPQSLRVPAGCRRRPTRGRKRGQRVAIPCSGRARGPAPRDQRARTTCSEQFRGQDRKRRRPAVWVVAERPMDRQPRRFHARVRCAWPTLHSTGANCGRAALPSPRRGRRHVRPPVAMSISVASTGSGREGQNEESLCHVRADVMIFQFLSVIWLKSEFYGISIWVCGLSKQNWENTFIVRSSLLILQPLTRIVTQRCYYNKELSHSQPAQSFST